jgi:hypothetical protein
MVRPVSLPLQTIYAELVERAAVAQLRADFPVQGSFFVQEIKGKSYWYFQEPQSKGRRQRYVGPDTPDLRQTIEQHKAAKEDHKQRREMVVALLRAGFKGPDSTTGKVLEALADAGAFRMRAVVVGTVAYQVYSGLLGIKLGASNMTTSDLDLAQFENVSTAVEDRMGEPFGAILQRINPAFRPIPHLSDKRRVTQYGIGSQYRVDLLVPNTGPETDEPVALPALQADGQPLRFLDYLIYNEVRAVVLHGPGVLVNVPAPERYALHKLIVSRLRLQTKDSQAKAAKDWQQASELIQVLAEQRPYELQSAWEELMSRGPGWRRRAVEGVSSLSTVARDRLLDIVGRLPAEDQQSEA